MARHIIIVSFDGGKPAVMRACKMPHTLRMAAKGAHTWSARTIVPSITLPSHTSMLTGVGPEVHKITWNDYQEAKGVVKVPTAFQLAKARGLTTALFAGKEKFKHLAVPGSLDAFRAEASEALKVAAWTAEAIERSRPNLTFVHFPDADGAGHSKGWGGPEQREAFENCDKALGLLIQAVQRAGIARHTAFLLSADHGGHDKTHGTNRPDDVLIPWIAYGSGIRHRRIIDPVYTCDTAATALHLLGVPIPADWEGQPVASALR